MVRLSVAEDGYEGVTLAWSVVVRDIDALPRAERELAVAHREAHIVSGQHGFDVRVGVSLGMLELFLARHELSKLREQVVLHRGIRVLIYEHARGGVEHRDDADAVLHLRSRHRGAHASRDIDGAHLRRRADLEALVMSGQSVSLRAHCPLEGPIFTILRTDADVGRGARRRDA